MDRHSIRLFFWPKSCQGRRKCHPQAWVGCDRHSIRFFFWPKTICHPTKIVKILLVITFLSAVWPTQQAKSPIASVFFLYSTSIHFFFPRKCVPTPGKKIEKMHFLSTRNTTWLFFSNSHIIPPKKKKHFSPFFLYRKSTWHFYWFFVLFEVFSEHVIIVFWCSKRASHCPPYKFGHGAAKHQISYFRRLDKPRSAAKNGHFFV